MGTAVIAAAGAAAAREMDRVLTTFRVADATAPGRAQSLDQLGLVGSRAVERLFNAGVLLPGAANGTVYLSEAAYVEFRRARRKPAMIAVVLAVGLMFLGVAFALFMSSRPQ